MESSDFPSGGISYIFVAGCKEQIRAERLGEGVMAAAAENTPRSDSQNIDRRGAPQIPKK